MAVTTSTKTPWLPRWPGWRHLPREARDTLFLLGVIGWTVLPHIPNIPWWCSLLTAGVLLWRARLAVSNAALPGRWALIAVLAAATALTLWSFKTVLGKEPGVTMAVVLMALKTLELRARRDAFVVFFLGFFLILTHFLYSQTLLVAVAMLVSVWGLLTALVLSHMPVGKPALRLAGGLALRTALLGAPVMALLFVFFPRLGPLWGTPTDGLTTTGLSNSMRMGSMSEVVLSDAVAMRIRFLDAPPPPQERYFRGPVLSQFDGRQWLPGVSQFQPRGELRVRGSPVRYEVTLEPQRIAAIPVLEVTPDAPQLGELRTRQGEDLVWYAQRPLFERLRFTATSYTRFDYGPPELPRFGMRDYVRLPPGYNPRTLAWAAELRRDPRYANADGKTLALAVMRHIRTAGFSYTLSPGTYGEENPRVALDEFWLDRKLGFCEHFAAAFVVVMRAMDIPARVVTGYQGTDRDPVDGYYVVRQSSAHAWAEYWQQGAGWVRADPTAAVAPDRIFDNRSLRPPPGLVAGALGDVNQALLTQMRDAWEAVNNRWNQWVLDYSRGQQLELMKKLGYDTPSWEDMALLLITLFSVAALGGAAWAWWDRRRQDPWQRQAQALRKGLRALGLDAPPHAPPRQLATDVRRQFGDGGQALAELLHALDRQRYAQDAISRPSAAWWSAVRAELRGLRASMRRTAPR
jgi:transglutaminase-like putative cysteine protease